MPPQIVSKKTYIDESLIEDAGRGVFAAKHLKKGEVIEVAPIIIFPHNDMANRCESILNCYYYSTNPEEDWGYEQTVLGLGHSSMYNRSEEPNATWELDTDDKIITITALRRIAKNDEITIRYWDKPTMEGVCEELDEVVEKLEELQESMSQLAKNPECPDCQFELTSNMRICARQLEAVVSAYRASHDEENETTEGCVKAAIAQPA